MLLPAVLVIAQTTLSAVGTQAFYVLFSDQIRSPQWPQKLCQNNGVFDLGLEIICPKIDRGMREEEQE